MTTIRAFNRYDEDGEPHIELVGDTASEPETDWAALEAMTEEEVLAAALSDPDGLPSTPEQLRRMIPGNEARRVRHRLGMKQVEFAERFGIPLGTLRDWEQKRSEPGVTGLILLRTILRDPDLVASVVDTVREDGALEFQARPRRAVPTAAK